MALLFLQIDSASSISSNFSFASSR